MKHGEEAAASSSTVPVENMLTASATEISLKQHQHLQVGSNFTHKDHGPLIFTMLGVQGDQVQFQHCPLVGQPLLVTVPISAELANWKRSKKVQPTALDPTVAEMYSVTASKQQTEAFQLSQAQAELYRHYTKYHDKIQGLSFVTPPPGLVATVEIPKKSLTLVAFGQLLLVKDPSKVRDSFMVGDYMLQAPKTVTDFDRLDEKSLLVPFWSVRSTSEVHMVNLTFVHQQLGGLKVPSYINTRTIAKGEVLYCANESLIAKQSQASAPVAGSPVKRHRQKGPGHI